MDTLKKSLKSGKLADISAFCYVDICKVCFYLPLFFDIFEWLAGALFPIITSLTSPMTAYNVYPPHIIVAFVRVCACVTAFTGCDFCREIGHVGAAVPDPLGGAGSPRETVRHQESPHQDKVGSTPHIYRQYIHMHVHAMEEHMYNPRSTHRTALTPHTNSEVDFDQQSVMIDCLVSSFRLSSKRGMPYSIIYL